MERNPLFTKERASFYYEKIEYFYKNKAYSQALSEIEKNKDLLGAILNVGKQLSLNKIYAKCIVNVMLDIFEYDGDFERFDEYFTKYRTTLELHTTSDMYTQLQTYFNEKNKSSQLSSRDEKLSLNIEDAFGEYIEKEKTLEPVITSIKPKDSKAKSIEEDFLSSIGKPFIASAALKAEIKAEEKEIYGSKDEFEDFMEVKKSEPIKTLNLKEEKIDTEKIEIEKITSSEEELTLNKPVIDLSHTMVFSSELVQKKKNNPSKKSASKNSILDENLPPTKKETSSDSSFDYTKSSAKNKSGGKVTELSFDSFDSFDSSENIKTENSPMPENKPKKQSTSNDTKKKSGKKKKKKKKTQLPAIVFLIVILLVASALGVFAVKSNFLPNAKTYFKEFLSSKDAPNGTEEPTQELEPSEKTPNTPNENTDATSNSANEENTTDSSTEQDYILPSDTKSLTDEDLQGMDRSELRYAVNEMYARKGWHFNFGGDLYDYFSQKSWYKPDKSLNSPSDASAKFSEIENVNLATIIKYRNTLSE